MAKKDTFFLRTTITTEATPSTAYVSDNIDITGYVDVPRGRVLVVDNAYITYSTDGQGAIVPADIGTGAVSKQLGAQVCSEVQTSLVEMRNNSLFARSNIYAANSATGVMSLMVQTDALNPTTYESGFIIPTNQIHVGAATGSAWAGQLDIGFLFEVHTERLSLTRIQELLVSLTAN